MLLAVNVGNSHTVLGLLDGTVVAHHRRIATVARRTADELMALLRGLFADGLGERIDGLVVCSAVPSVQHEMRDLAAVYFADVPTLIVEPGVKTGLPVLVDNPREIGTDRIANAVAATHLFGGPCIIVDLGTATTFDVVTDRGAYVGGAIAPGIGVSIDALGDAGAQLRRVELLRPRSVIAKNTVEALQSGALYGFSGQVDGIVTRIAAELGHPLDDVTVVATGGLADLVLAETTTVDRHEPWLTLQGLRLIFERNHPTAA